jgi:hypothetical protein
MKIDQAVLGAKVQGMRTKVTAIASSSALWLRISREEGSTRHRTLFFLMHAEVDKEILFRQSQIHRS